MNLEQILIDKNDQMIVGEITKKYRLADEIAYAIMWCIDKVPYSQILPRLSKLTHGMKSKEIERIMRDGQ